MTVQTNTTNVNKPFVLAGFPVSLTKAIVFKDAGRTAVLAFGTIMAKIASSQKWVPLTDLAAVDGSAVAQGVYIGANIPAAKIAANDVPDCQILIGSGAILDVGQIVLENSLELDDVCACAVAVGVGDKVHDIVTVRDLLARRGIILEETELAAGA